jgi:hypothetical protein
MFGKRKRNINREADDLRQRLEHLESEAHQLHEEIEALESRKNDPRPILLPLHGPDVYVPSSAAPVRRSLKPTRRQHRRKRNLAVILIIASVFVLTWIVAKFWRYMS